jgi:hypothetical protein
MAGNCYALEEQPPGSRKKKRNQVCFHGGGKARKKKLGLSRLWKRLLEWLWAALDQVSASGFKCARLGLKPKHGSRAGPKPMVKKNSAGFRSSSVDSDLGLLGISAGSESDSVPAQLEMSPVAFLSVSGDSAIR